MAIFSKSNKAISETEAAAKAEAKAAADVEAASPLRASQVLQEAVSAQVMAEPIEAEPAVDAPAETAQPGDGEASSGDPGYDADREMLVDVTDATIDLTSSETSGQRIVGDVRRVPPTDPAASIDESSSADDAPSYDGWSEAGGKSDDPVEGIDTTEPSAVDSRPTTGVDVDDEQATRDWAVEQFGGEAVDEREADLQGEGGGTPIPTHTTVEVNEGGEFADRNPLASEPDGQLQSVESVLAGDLPENAGIPGQMTTEEIGSLAGPPSDTGRPRFRP